MKKEKISSKTDMSIGAGLGEWILKELIDDEINPQNKQADQNAEVWRYLISTDEQLYFKFSHSVDYIVLKEGMNYIYEVLDFIYHIVDEYLSS